MQAHAQNSSAVSLFQFQEAFDVRVILVNNDPWFIASDLAKVLEYPHTPHMVRMCDDDEKGVQIVDTLGGKQKTTVISEPGLYRIMAVSRSERAKPFQRWLFHTVLPTLRRTGGYALPTPAEPGNLVTVPEIDPSRAIHDAVHAVARGNQSIARRLYSRLHGRFGVGSYKDITVARCGEALEYIRSVEGEYIPKTAPVEVPAAPEAGMVLHPEQAREINERLDRIMVMFHPFSEPFRDALGIRRALCGRDPRTGTDRPGYAAMLEMPDRIRAAR